MPARAESPEPSEGRFPSKLLLQIKADALLQRRALDLAEERLEPINARTEPEKIRADITALSNQAPVIPGEVCPGYEARMAVAGRAAQHAVPVFSRLPLDVQSKVVAGQRHNHRVN